MGVEVWLTGYEPFGEHQTNISQQIAEHLADFNGVISIGPPSGPMVVESREIKVEIKSQILTVDKAGSELIASSIAESDTVLPQAIIHLGLAENREVISLEATAFNELDFRIADNEGRQVTSDNIIDSGHNLSHSTAPVNLLMAEFCDEGLICKSEDPGRFICNETYFKTLQSVEQNDLRDRVNRAIPVLFIHLPPADKIPLETQISLVKRVIGVTVQRPEMQVVGGMLKDENNRLLAARRSAEEYMGGYWEFPGGKVEKGESKEAAISREYHEEFGWTVKPLRVCEEYSHAWPEMVVHLTFFLCEADGELPPAVMTSHDENRWLSEDELMDVEWLPPDVEFVKRIKERGIANL
jgi:8-oxo-dGTP diphosphatase